MQMQMQMLRFSPVAVRQSGMPAVAIFHTSPPANRTATGFAAYPDFGLNT
jgi:hypothetical protein